MSKHIRHGRGSVRPYVYGDLELPKFVREVFGAKEIEHHDYPSGGAHIEAAIGDSIIVLEAAPSFPSKSGVTKNSIYVYVPDVDAVYKRALAVGATSISAPEQKPYQERACGVKDSFGNIWYISTYTGAGAGKHVRNGFGCVRPYVYGRRDLLAFAKNVFDADELELNAVAGGFHVEYQIGDSVLIAVGMDPPYAQATLSSIYVYVKDVDAIYKGALENGATSITPPELKPYQERQCGVRDSFGNTWWISTHAD